MTNPFHALRQRPRLLSAIVVSVLLAVLLPFGSVAVRLLAGWCLGVALYLGLVFAQALAQPRDGLQREASALDDSALAISLFAILAAGASFGAVAMIVFGERHQDGYEGARVALAAATMVASWAFVQVVFAIHYAHLYYGEGTGGGARGGLDFNGDDAPDFWDFLYFSVTIGATSQTSDTDITAKTMRRLATVQTVYAFFFNTSVLALAINMAAGLAQH